MLTQYPPGSHSVGHAAYKSKATVFISVLVAHMYSSLASFPVLLSPNALGDRRPGNEATAAPPPFVSSSSVLTLDLRSVPIR